MGKGIKIVLPDSDTNAVTDTDPRLFSLYVDGSEDHILVKEKTRGTESVNGGATDNVAHGLSYTPLAMAHAEVSSGEFQWSYGFSFYNLYQMYVTSSNLVLQNLSGSAKTFTYIIFHDEL